MKEFWKTFQNFMLAVIFLMLLRMAHYFIGFEGMTAVGFSVVLFNIMENKKR